MVNIIAKLEDKYLEWSTVVGAPLSVGLSRDEFAAYYREQYGDGKLEKLNERLDRADQTGTSDREGCDLEELIIGNQAGPDMSELTLEQIAQAYCRRAPILDGWLPQGVVDVRHNNPTEKD
jgi:hypothetical protein